MKNKSKSSSVTAGVVLIAVIVMAPTLEKIISKPLCNIVIMIASIAVLITSGRDLLNSRKAKRRRMEEKVALMGGVLRHISGLPIAEGLYVEVYYCQDKILFQKDAQEMVISIDKITSMDLISRDTWKQSLEGAAAGKYVHGEKIGPTIGRLSASVTHLVISYTSDGKRRSVVLDTALGGMNPVRMVKEFRKTHPQKQSTIEL